MRCPAPTRQSEAIRVLCLAPTLHWGLIAPLPVANLLGQRFFTDMLGPRPVWEQPDVVIFDCQYFLQRPGSEIGKMNDVGAIRLVLNDQPFAHIQVNICPFGAQQLADPNASCQQNPYSSLRLVCQI